MTDYNLGKASGKIELDYDGTGADEAVVDLDRVTGANERLDSSLHKTQGTLRDTNAELKASGTSAEGYAKRLEDVRKAADEVDKAEKDYHRTLLDTNATLRDVEVAEDRVSEAKKRHAAATHAERDAHRALGSEMSSGQRVMRAFGDIIPNLERNLSRLAHTTEDTGRKTNLLARGLGDASKVMRLLGPEAEAAAGGLNLASRAADRMGGAASAGGQHVRNFIKDLAGFETKFGKIGGLALGLPSLGGLAGIGGAAGLQGITEVAGAVRQLSGALALLPAAGAGAGVVMGTMKVALHGVGDALKDMMADDPKKFLEDIKNMAPAAAHAMLQVAQFRDQFKLGGAAIQTSFFEKINADIQPLIQTWLPALVAGGSKIAGVMGQAADAFAKLLMQPQMMAAFGQFIDNISKGLTALTPAMKPLLDMFTQLAVVGSSLFQAIGGQITQMLNFFDQVVSKAAADGSLQRFMTEGVNAIFHVINALYSFGAAFNHVMDIADRFGGGGLLGWIDKLGQQLNTWTQSAAGQKALTDFFTTMRTATDAFLPMLGPLVQGLASIGTAFVQLGINIAPAWLDFFKTFAHEMTTDLGPAIQGMGPALSTFLGGMTDAFRQMMQTVGPQLPALFQNLANAMVQLMPQLPQLAALFVNLVQQVGPQLPQLFRDVMTVLRDLVPLMPVITGFFRDFVSAVNVLVNIGDAAVRAINGIADAFSKLAGQALRWGKDLINGFVQGMDSMANAVTDAIKRNITDHLPDFVKKALGISSPSRVFHEIGLNLMQGLQLGIAAGSGAVVAAAAGVAQQVTATTRAGLVGGAGAASGAAAIAGGGGSGVAPTAGGTGYSGGSLVPSWIAHANVGVLDTYLKHEPDPSRGLAGFAKDMGKMLQAVQSGSTLLFQHLLQPLGQVMGMMPSLSAPTWKKMTPQQLAEQQQQQKAQEQAAKAGPTWNDVNGTGGTPPGATPVPGASGTPTGAPLPPAPGDSALVAALKAKGFSAQQIRLIEGFSTVEGKNPAGNPTLGWTDAQLGGATDLQSHVDALAKQFQDRAGVAGPFPENGTDLERAQWIAKVVGQTGSSSDWQGNAQPKDYVQRVLAAMPAAAPGASATGPGAAPLPKGFKSWPGYGAPTATPPPPGAGGPGYAGDAALLANVPSGRYLQTQAADLTKGIGDCSSAVEDLINMMDGAATAGRQMATGNAAQWLSQRGFMPTDKPMPGTFQVGYSSSHMQATLPGGTPFNWGSDAAAQQRGIGGTGAWDPAFTSHYYRPISGTPGAPIDPQAAAAAAASGGYPDVAHAQEMIAQENLTTNQRLLNAYLAGNPALASQIDAAKSPGASDQQVQSTLNNISTTIAGLKTQDAIGNKNTIDALTSTQNDIAQNAGFQQGPSPAQAFSSVVSGASGIASSVIGAIQGGLDALTATQDIADRLVYGVRNTEDINKLIDDVQKYIAEAANITAAVGSILSAAGGMTGGSDFGGTAAAGQIMSLISGIISGVNAAIDFGQQIYHVVGSYVGKFLTDITGLAGVPLMGDVRMQLNTNTGQLIAYSQDNPENKDYINVPSWMNQLYDYNGQGNANPQVNTQYNIWGGPGMSAGELLNQSVWMSQTQGTSGAAAAVNF